MLQNRIWDCKSQSPRFLLLVLCSGRRRNPRKNGCQIRVVFSESILRLTSSSALTYHVSGGQWWSPQLVELGILAGFAAVLCEIMGQCLKAPLPVKCCKSDLWSIISKPSCDTVSEIQRCFCKMNPTVAELIKKKRKKTACNQTILNGWMPAYFQQFS